VVADVAGEVRGVALQAFPLLARSLMVLVIMGLATALGPADPWVLLDRLAAHSEA